MTYAQVLLLFVAPLVALAAWGARRVMDRRRWLALGGVMALAVVYTTPWDSAIIARGVFYDADRVLGVRFWGIPLEEFCFFLLQTALTGLFTYRLLGREPGPTEGAAGEKPAPARAGETAISARSGAGEAEG
ncbi:MAG: lycopene cyclase domain-containing protein [Dehalococcoidia bacterium]